MNICVSYADKLQNLTDDNYEQLFRYQYIKDEFNPAQVQAIAEHLCDPANMSIFMVSKKLADVCNETEEWY